MATIGDFRANVPENAKKKMVGLPYSDVPTSQYNIHGCFSTRAEVFKNMIEMPRLCILSVSNVEEICRRVSALVWEFHRVALQAE